MNIVIVDDHNIIIDGLEMLLSLENSVKVEKSYNDGYEFLEDLRRGVVQPNIVLMDLMMPSINGLELSKILKKEFQNIKIIILSMNCESKVVYELIEKIGVNGYLSKKINRKELITAITDVASGFFHLSDEAEKTLSDFKKKLISYPEIKLSAREKEIVNLMINGFTNREIAEKLFISESTVETHRKNIYRKTEAKSLPKLIQMVSHLNLLENIN